MYTQKYSNLEFARDLVDLMTHEIPDLRPVAAECLKEWCYILQFLPPSTRRRHLRLRELDSHQDSVLHTARSRLTSFITRGGLQ